LEDFKPIEKAIAPRKAQQWHYKIHPYFTKQASNVVRSYIEWFSKKGDTVLDPFCGSGVTAIEALTLRRKAIVVDIAPLAIFITRQTCIAPVDLDEFQFTFNKIEKKLKDTVKFVRKAKSKEIETCQIKDWYPKKVKLPSNADCEYVEALFGKKELIVLSGLLKEIKKIKNPQIMDLMLFTFSGILHRASKTYFIDKKEEGGGNSGIFTKFRYWIPARPDVRDVWELFENRFNIVRRAKEYSNRIINDFFRGRDTFIAYVDSATNLSDYIKSNSVDYIYTDPPYGAHIAYLDLTTMWDAWLGFKVTQEARNLEVIEGGDQRHTQEEYLDLLTKSIIEMYKVLKKDGWLSMVFHHRETRLWYAIRDAAKNTGFEYMNTVAQPISKQTFHKIKNPLKVLGEQLIINFRKSKKLYPVIEPEALPAVKVILNAAEREIVKSGGATLEEIMRAVVPELFQANLIDKIALKTSGDVVQLLTKEFELGPDERWHIRKENEQKIGHYLPAKDRIRYYLISFLRREKKADFDQIVTTIFPLLNNSDRKPTRKDILGVLEEVAVSRNGRLWELKRPEELVIQHEFDLGEEKVLSTEVPAGSRHDQMIYRLIVLGNKVGFIPYLGKREMIIAGKDIFKDLNYLKEFPLKNLRVDLRKKIEQIDCIWFHKDKTPLFAFEVEETTAILSALERFHSLLEVESRIGLDKRLVIVAPKSRQRKLTQELTHSGYIGHPIFLEQKVVYMFSEAFLKAYPDLMRKLDPNVEDIDRLFISPKVLKNNQ
jgi:DNA modification methylase